MADKNKYVKASPQLVNYDWSDVQAGVGYIDYFLIESETAAGKDYHLTTKNDYSNNVAIGQGGAATFDFDYDLTPFVIAQDIEGTALLSLAVSTGGSVATNFTAELYQVIGGVETIIGSAITYTANINGGKMLYMPMIIPYTHFAEGDALRLRFVSVIPGATAIFYGIDPAGRANGTFITTTSKISIPYKTNQ
jgi:hypothetical protein